MTLKTRSIPSPVGPLRLVASDQSLLGVFSHSQPERYADTPTEERTHKILDQAVFELNAYFEDPSSTFSIALDPLGTAFQLSVWKQLQRIPDGQTQSYSQIAEAIGNPGAVRAVGAANGKNPISIIVPCHRVIGSTGKLTGYAGGLDMKLWLLRHEGALLV